MTSLNVIVDTHFVHFLICVLTLKLNLKFKLFMCNLCTINQTVRTSN